MSEEEAIKIVKEFNQENRFRDMGKLNNAIDTVVKLAETYIKSKNVVLTEQNELKSPSFTGEQLSLMNLGIQLYLSFKHFDEITELSEEDDI